MSFATDYNAEDRPGSLTPRGVFVPPWYQPHKQLNVEVKDSKGKSLGFTIGDVAVERRWAIDPEGNVLAGHEFVDKLTEWYIGQWQWRNPPQPSLPVDTNGYPSPETYVSKGPNPSNPRQLITLTLPNHRRANEAVERPVDPQQLARTGWAPAPKKE